MTCAICLKEIENPNQAWKQSVGWVSPRGSKGMTAAHPTGKLAHSECVVLLKAGISSEQEVMV
jgi:hypothetical protein